MIRLDPRLRCALSLLAGSDVVADIGCDHGKLAAALLERNVCRRVIAGDVSVPCLEKARALTEKLGLKDRVETRLGSGLSILRPGECDAAALLGMGGELIADLLDASADVASGMDRLILQPMSGVDKLRRWLYQACYRVAEDRLVMVGRRTYQILQVRRADAPDPWPEGFPRDCWLVGYRAFQNRDALLENCCREMLEKRRRLLPQVAGTGGEGRLLQETGQLTIILQEIEKWT